MRSGSAKPELDPSAGLNWWEKVPIEGPSLGARETGVAPGRVCPLLSSPRSASALISDAFASPLPFGGEREVFRVLAASFGGESTEPLIRISPEVMMRTSNTRRGFVFPGSDWEFVTIVAAVSLRHC